MDRVPIQVTSRKTDKGQGLWVSDIFDWFADAEGGCKIVFNDRQREPLVVTETVDQVTAKIQAAIAGTVAASYLQITDGVTAPGALAGVARLYVDTADGDLKVVFADGFVRTIGADS